MTSSEHKPAGGSIRAFATWAVVLVMAVAGVAALFLVLRTLLTDATLVHTLVVEHVRAMVGIPMAAGTAFCILLIFEARAGHVEFEALGFKFRGGAGPAVIWVFAFLAFVGAVRLLW